MDRMIHVVGAVAFRGDKVFLARRAPHKTMAYKWEFPGGKVEVGETEAEALSREIDEELSVGLKIFSLLDSSVTFVGDLTISLSTFLCEFVGEPQVSSDHDEMGWFDFDELEALDIAEPDFPALVKLRDLMNG